MGKRKPSSPLICMPDAFRLRRYCLDRADPTASRDRAADVLCGGDRCSHCRIRRGRDTSAGAGGNLRGARGNSDPHRSSTGGQRQPGLVQPARGGLARGRLVRPGRSSDGAAGRIPLRQGAAFRAHASAGSLPDRDCHLEARPARNRDDVHRCQASPQSALAPASSPRCWAVWAP